MKPTQDDTERVLRELRDRDKVRAESAEQQVADLKHEIGEYTDKLEEIKVLYLKCSKALEATCCALAASQAEVAALRREIGAVVCDTDAAGMHSDTCWRCLLLARSVVPGSTDALREFGVKVASAAWHEGWYHALAQSPGDPTAPTGAAIDAIVDSILAGGGR